MSLKRRRTEIREIESKPAKLVAFSKRRKGLFNKAKEIGTLCGARVGIVVFSPAGKPYLVGDDVIDEFTTERGMGTEFVDVVNWVESALGGCRTVDDLESLIRDYESLHQMVEHRLKGSSTVASSGGAFLGSCPCPCPSPSSLLERPDGLGCRVVGLLAAPNLISETENPPLDVMEGRAVTGDPLVPPGTENLSCNSSDNMVGGVRGTDLSLESAGSSMMEAEVAANWGGAFLGPCPSALLDRSDVVDFQVVGLQAALNPITETEYPLLLDSDERLPNLIDVMEGYNSSDNIGGVPGTDLSPDSVSSSMTGAEVATNWGGAFLGPCPSSTLLDRQSIGYQVDGFQAASNPVSETEYPLLLEMEEQLLHDMPDGTRSSSGNIEGGTGTDLSPDTAGSSMTQAEIEEWVNSLLSGN